MTLATLYPPIALATVLNVVLFALAWRAGKVEKRRGETPWYLSGGLLAYILPLVWFVRSADGQPIEGYWRIFGAGLVGEAIGAVILFGLLNAFVFSRGKPVRQRVLPIALAGVAVLVMLTGAFAR